MYRLAKTPVLDRETLVDMSKTRSAVRDDPVVHSARIKRELLEAGLSAMLLRRAECKMLPEIIHPDERIGGVIYGMHNNSRSLLVATDRRVIFLDKTLMYTTEDEINYDVAAGVNYGKGTNGCTVTLYTRIKDYDISTNNRKSAEKFIEFIEARTLEHAKGERRQNGRANRSW